MDWKTCQHTNTNRHIQTIARYFCVVKFHQNARRRNYRVYRASYVKSPVISFRKLRNSGIIVYTALSHSSLAAVWGAVRSAFDHFKCTEVLLYYVNDLHTHPRLHAYSFLALKRRHYTSAKTALHRQVWLAMAVYAIVCRLNQISKIL